MDLHKLKVEITGDLRDLKKKCDEVKAESKRTMEAANKEFAKIGDNQFAANVTKQWEEVKKQTAAQCKKIQQIAKQSKVDAGLIEPTNEYKVLIKDMQVVQKEIDSLKAKQNSLSGKDATGTMTKEYETLSMQVKNAEKSLESMHKTQLEWLDAGIDVKSEPYKELAKNVRETHEEISTCTAKMKQLEAEGKAYTPSQRFLELQRQIQAAREKLTQYKVQEETLSSKGKDYVPTKSNSELNTAKAYAKGFGSAGINEARKLVRELSRLHPALEKAIRLAQKFGKNAERAFSTGSKAAKAASIAFKVPIGFLKILGSGFGTVLTKLKGAIPTFNRTGRAMNSMYSSSTRLGRAWNTLKMTAGFMLASFVLMGSARAAADGFINLSQYSEKTNADLSMLMSTLTQLKNSFATAFAPILTVVAPILNTLIGYATTATTAVAHFFAALTGQSTVVIAKKVNQDFAASVAETGSAASDANSKADKLKRTLMGFDRINKLDSQDNSASSGTKLSPSEMFETVEVKNAAAGWVEKIKEAWAKADFTDIGETLGEKLNTGLNSLNWSKIKGTLDKAAKSIATFLNGFIRKADWGLIGKTLSEGFNTIFSTGYSFVTTFDWKKFGTAIGNSINGFVKNIDLAKAGQFLSNLVTGILNTAIKAIETADWEEIGTKIAEFITNIDYIEIGKLMITLIGKGIVAAFEILKGFINELGDKLKEYIKSGKIWTDIFEIAGLVVDIGISLFKVGWTTIGKFIGTLVSVGVSLFKSGYKSLKEFIGEKTSVIVERTKGWKTKLEDWIGKRSTVEVSRKKNWTTSVDKWIGDKSTVKVSRKKGWTTTLREFLGMTKSSNDSKAQKITRSKGWTTKLSTWLGIDSEGFSQKIKLKKSGWTGIKSWLGIDKEFTLGFKLPKIKVTWGEKEVAGFKISYPNGFATYATGGFPEEGPFYMNRGEIAGKFSNGKSVVANNQQITDGIASAVGPAVYEAVMAALMQGGGNNKSVTVVLQGDSKKLFKVVKEEADNYSRATGNPAFDYY